MGVPAFRVWVPDAGTPGFDRCYCCKKQKDSTFHQATRHENGRPIPPFVKLCELCWYDQLQTVMS